MCLLQWRSHLTPTELWKRLVLEPLVARASTLLWNRCFLYLFGPSARSDRDDHDDHDDHGDLVLGTIHWLPLASKSSAKLDASFGFASILETHLHVYNFDSTCEITGETKKISTFTFLPFQFLIRDIFDFVANLPNLLPSADPFQFLSNSQNNYRFSEDIMINLLILFWYR